MQDFTLLIADTFCTRLAGLSEMSPKEHVLSLQPFKNLLIKQPLILLFSKL